MGILSSFFPQNGQQQLTPLQQLAQHYAKQQGGQANQFNAQPNVQQPRAVMPNSQPDSQPDSQSTGPLSQYLQKAINPGATNLPWQPQGLGGLIKNGATSLADGGMNFLATLFGG